MKSIVIAGALAQKPGRGGHTWVFLQYLLGFKKLGWQVTFVDRLAPEMCVDETHNAATLADSWNVRYVREVMCRFGLDADFSILLEGEDRTIGLSRAAVTERVRSAHALINVMGFLRDDEILAAADKRVFLDIDPGFAQMWCALGLHDAFRGHDAYVSIGENIGEPWCAIPTCGLPWVTTCQPVVLEHWPASFDLMPAAPITSVISWRGAYGAVTYRDKTYGLRAREFRKFAALPTLVDGPFELALDIDAGDAKDGDLLSQLGWSLVSPREVARDPWCYRDYIRRSAAELMVAKNMYVDTKSGWISDRSLCYLASGRPVIAQDTGLGDLLPTGAGLLTFSSLDEAAEAARAVRREPQHHQRAARQLAEENFDSALVLGRLTHKLGLD